MTAEGRPVLVTRPQGCAAEQFCRTLSEAGYRPLHLPMMSLEPLDPLPGEARSRVMNLDRYRHVIFISANAARYGLALIENYWPQLPVGIRWYAIGSATAALLSRHGIAAATPDGAMTSEGLLALASLQSVAGDRVLIVKGEGGRDTLRRSLAARGGAVDEVACYRRRPPVMEAGALGHALRESGSEVILFSSGEGLANFLRLLTPAETSNFVDRWVIVPSARVAEQARAAGFSRTRVADNATDEAMLRALQALETDPGE